MNNIREIGICFRVNIRKQIVNPRIYTILAIIIVFQYYAFAVMPTVCEYLNMACTPWVFPFFLGNPSLFFIFGGIAMLLYCDAPFWGKEAPFLIMRMGRRNWILGQVIYVYLSGLMYTLFTIAVSVIMLIPCVSFSGDWGDVLHTIALNPQIFTMAGVKGGFYPYAEIMDLLSPLQAMLVAGLLYWLGTVLIGLTILSFRVCFGGMMGIAICGIFTSIAYFTPYLGSISFGKVLYYFSPITWSCMSYLDWYGAGEVPTFPFVVTVYCLLIIIMSVVSVIAFCKKDINWEDV